MRGTTAAECAHWFDKQAFFRPLVDGRDPLPGLAANTHLAQVRTHHRGGRGRDREACMSHFVLTGFMHAACVCCLWSRLPGLPQGADSTTGSTTPTRPRTLPLALLLLLQVQGFAARYEQLGDEEALTATASFFGLLLQVRGWARGRQCCLGAVPAAAAAAAVACLPPGLRLLVVQACSLTHTQSIVVLHSRGRRRSLPIAPFIAVIAIMHQSSTAVSLPLSPLPAPHHKAAPLLLHRWIQLVGALGGRRQLG